MEWLKVIASACASRVQIIPAVCEYQCAGVRRAGVGLHGKAKGGHAVQTGLHCLGAGAFEGMGKLLGCGLAQIGQGVADTSNRFEHGFGQTERTMAINAANGRATQSNLFSIFKYM